MGKKRSNNSSNCPLNILADFLNFDFEKGDPAKLRGRDGAHMIVFLHWTDDDEAKILQAEIRKELAAIVPPATSKTPEEAYGLLDAFITKINGMGLKQEWHIEGVDYEVGGYPDFESGKFELELHKRRSDERREVYNLTGYRQGVLKLLEYDWIVSTKIFQQVETFRQSLYWVIIDALESGELSRLAKCSNCPRFFVTEDRRQEYCTSRCRRSYETAPYRKAKWKTRKEQEQAERTEKTKQELAFSRFLQFIELARKVRCTESEQDHILPILKRLGRGTVPHGWNKVNGWKGLSPESIWEHLSMEDRRIFIFMNSLTLENNWPGDTDALIGRAASIHRP